MGYNFLMRIFSLFCIASTTWASILPPPSASMIARLPGGFAREGFYEGGANVTGELTGLRVAKHPGFERWVFDLAAEPSLKTKTADVPRFQVQYIPAEFTVTEIGTNEVVKPARVRLTLRKIATQKVQPGHTATLLKKSAEVERVDFYPQIEDGDMVIELILKGDISFRAHQPAQRTGRLVLDFKK